MFAWLTQCRVPIMAEVIGPRAVALSVAAIGTAQLGLGCFHLGLPCAFHQMTGLPCPGCGLTRSVLALLRGNPRDSFLLHPFGSILLACLFLALLAGILPTAIRDRLTRAVEWIELKTGITFIAMAVFVLVWGLRVSGVIHLDPV
jgi:hypothetical protein